MTYNKRFSLESGRFYDGEEILTDEEVLNILNGLDEGINKVLKELYRKDIRKDINLHEENKELKKQMNRLYNYFMDWHSDEMGANQFSEMWDMVKENEGWDCK